MKIPNKEISLFFDRDGVINVDTGYPKDFKDLIFIEETINELKILSDLGYQIYIVTNQSGIARGYFSKQQYLKLQKEIEFFLLEKGIKVIETAFCPHHPEGIIEDYSFECECRKPKIGMLRQLSNKYKFKLSNSAIIGDKVSDIKAGLDAGCSLLIYLGEEFRHSKAIPNIKNLKSLKNLSSIIYSHFK